MLPNCGEELRQSPGLLWQWSFLFQELRRFCKNDKLCMDQPMVGDDDNELDDDEDDKKERLLEVLKLVVSHE